MNTKIKTAPGLAAASSIGKVPSISKVPTQPKSQPQKPFDDGISNFTHGGQVIPEKQMTQGLMSQAGASSQPKTFTGANPASINGNSRASQTAIPEMAARRTMAPTQAVDPGRLQGQENIRQTMNPTQVVDPSNPNDPPFYDGTFEPLPEPIWGSRDPIGADPVDPNPSRPTNPTNPTFNPVEIDQPSAIQAPQLNNAQTYQSTMAANTGGNSSAGGAQTYSPTQVPQVTQGGGVVSNQQAGAFNPAATVSSGTADRVDTPVNMPTRYEAQDGAVTNDMLVEDRVAGLMSQDSEAMRVARENAMRLSASRGLQSSSIATENAINSMFNFATPIAQQDAMTHKDQSMLNQANRQRIGEQDNQALNQLNINRDTQNFQSGENAADRMFQSELENQRSANSYNSAAALQDDQQVFTSSLEDQRLNNQLAVNQNQQQFTAGENAADRNFQSDLQRLDTERQLAIQQNDQSFRAGEAAADRTFQSAMADQQAQNQLTVQGALQDDAQLFNRQIEDLRYQNSLGMLDAENADRLEQMERQSDLALKQMDRGAEIQSARDELMQTFTENNLSFEAVSALERIEAQAKASLEVQSNQNSFARSMEYSNAISNAVNNGIQSLGQAFMNPEIDPSQYRNIQNQINQMIDSQISDYADIYGITQPGDDGSGSGGSNGGGSDSMWGPNIGTPPADGGLIGGGTFGGTSGGITGGTSGGGGLTELPIAGAGGGIPR